MTGVSLASSMRRPEVSSRSSLRTSSVMLSPTLNTPRGRLSPPWMSSMPSRGKAEPSTDSVVKLFIFKACQLTHPNGPFQDQKIFQRDQLLVPNFVLFMYRLNLLKRKYKKLRNYELIGMINIILLKDLLLYKI